MTTLRLLSYNVRSLRDDADALVRVIRAAEPDVVCVQEAPRLLRWRSNCAALARRSGLVVVTGGRPAAGNLIMSTLGVQVLASGTYRLSRDPGRHQRGVAVALLAIAGIPFVVAGTHLDLAEPARVRHVGELHTALTAFLRAHADEGVGLHLSNQAGDHVGDQNAGPASVIAADVNDQPGSDPWSALATERSDVFGAVGIGDGFTYPAVQPQRRIDAVFADPRLRPISARVLDTPGVRSASDHRPLLVELGLD